MFDGIEGLCAPALIYLIYGTTRIIVETYKGLYNLALMQVFVTIIFSYLLNVLCRAGMGVVSWIIVFIPFLLMSAIAGVLLVVFGLNPATGKTLSGQPPVIKLATDKDKDKDKDKDDEEPPTEDPPPEPTVSAETDTPSVFANPISVYIENFEGVLGKAPRPLRV